MSINIGGGELKELKPRILVLGVGGAGGVGRTDGRTGGRTVGRTDGHV